MTARDSSCYLAGCWIYYVLFEILLCACLQYLIPNNDEMYWPISGNAVTEVQEV